MFWKRKPKASDGGQPLPPQVRNALDATDQPDLEDSLDDDMLEFVAFAMLTRHGRSHAPADPSSLDNLYAALVKRLSVDRRRRLEQAVRQIVMKGETGVLALLPFMQGETDRTVISTAALDYAMLMPRVNGDPLSGPKFLVSRFDEAKGNDAVRLGILTGLILLGDERLLPLVKGRWKEFQSAEDRRRLAASRSGSEGNSKLT